MEFKDRYATDTLRFVARQGEAIELNAEEVNYQEENVKLLLNWFILRYFASKQVMPT